MRNYIITDAYGYTENYDFLYDLLDHALEKLNVDGVFSITFISDEEIHELNLKYRNIDKPTDVLSFALNDSEDNYERVINVLGDIFVSIPKMISQARDYKHSEKRELSFLCIHGLLHLLGYDHQTEAEEKIMFDLQREVLEDVNITK